MSYTKTVWTDTADSPDINATNLNKIEQGIYDATELTNSINATSGQKIYTKIVSGTVASAGSSTSISHGLTATNIVGIGGGFYNTSGEFFPIDFIWEDGSRTAHVFARATTSNIVVYSDSTLSSTLVGQTVKIVIQYI